MTDSQSQETDPLMEIDDAMLQQWSEEFSALCQSQMQKGEEYEVDGLPGWMHNDLFRYMFEELADLANYSRLMFYRIRVAQEVYIASGLDKSFQPDAGDPTDTLPSGPGSFITQSEVSGFVQGSGGFQDS